ncbi:MAG: MmcQ/YjbR family DNA-binding protein [Micropruina sp.]|uniref:MmcQ/YjbR family DNA-binding protein n=1 Tax=Micropruina sp. TaxID=2737536 RepID=UPI0039E26C1A
MRRGNAPAKVADIHAFAAALPHVTVYDAESATPVYQVGGKSFVFFRTPRPDAVDPDTGQRYHDVVVFWVADLAAKEALVRDPSTPFFTTPHFDGHPSVLLRLSRLAELTRAELAEVIEDAWLAQASARRGRLYLEGTEQITR